MRKAIIVVLIGLVIVSATFGTLVLLTPRPSDGTTNGTGNLLEIIEVVWDGGIWNGQYYIEIFNPTDRIIEASIYIFIENTKEKWDFIKCGTKFVTESKDIPLVETFYPNSTMKVYTHSKDYFYTDSVKVVAVSGDHYILEETIEVEKWIQAEVTNVEWGEMVNISYEPENARWINFTLFYYGEYITELHDFYHPIFKLEGYYDNSYSVIDTRGWHVQHGTSYIKMMGRTTISKYRLLIDDKRIWEGTVQEG